MERSQPARLPESVDGVDAAVGRVVDAVGVVLDERQVGRDVVPLERREAGVDLKCAIRSLILSLFEFSHDTILKIMKLTSDVLTTGSLVKIHPSSYFKKRNWVQE